MVSASVLALSGCSGNAALPCSSTERAQHRNVHLILSLIPPSPSSFLSFLSSCPFYPFSSLLFGLIPSPSSSSFSSSLFCIAIFLHPCLPPSPSLFPLSFPPLKYIRKTLLIFEYYAFVSMHGQACAHEYRGPSSLEVSEAPELELQASCELSSMGAGN